MSAPRHVRVAGLLLGIFVFVGCSSADSMPTATPGAADAGPGRLALEPGVDPAEVNDQVAVPTTTAPPASNGVADDPTAALASTEESGTGSQTDDPADPDGAADGTAAAAEDIDDPAAPSDFETLTAQLISFVETERGHTFDREPVIERLGPAEFGAAVAELIEADTERFRSELAAQTTVQRAFGVLGPDQDLATIQASFGDAGITALYDPTTTSIIVRDADVSPLMRTALVFELTRALDDQEFGIRRPEGEPRTAEVEWSRAAIVHGSATEITNRYRNTMTSAELQEESRQFDDQPRNVSLALFTSPWLELQFGRQFYGEVYVAELWAAGQEAVDAALADPPATSEALISADAGPATTVAAPPADGDVLAAGVWGQAGWIALLTEFADPEDAEALATGWGGDAFVAWNTGTASCVRAHIAADTAEDLDRWADALATWAEQGDRQLFFPTADLIRVTACG